MSCVNCHYDLCDIFVCKNEATIPFPILATQEGEYLLVLNYQGTAKVYKSTLMIGDIVSFEATRLNENYCYEGYIIQPNGLTLPIVTSDGSYSGIKFCTKQLRQLI